MKLTNTISLEKPKHTNRLVRETSPYLLQHAHNPVDWHPWNDDTLAKARSLDKMLLISIGYSTCHWCHVMERESFEDETVAKVMNDNFICIKVDREERPDVDQVYMDAVQLMTGSGGWPLNVFTLPDGRPFFGGTYFRKEQWLNLLENIALLYSTRRNELESQADDLVKGINSENLSKTFIDRKDLPDQFAKGITGQLKKRFDPIEGGFAGSPKFPMPNVLQFLFKSSFYYPDEEVNRFLALTLRKMAFGGIFDHIGGGFARYSTDAQWKIPHFEKMLYDNAQLVSVYAEAYTASKNSLYKEIVIQTLKFIKSELTHKSGAFFSALDADSEGEEGKYYVWKLKEIDEVLGSQADLFKSYYHINARALWEKGNNILLCTESEEEFAKRLGIDKTSVSLYLMASRKKLLKYRQKRVKPSLDDKILTSWNALMIKGYVDAYKAFGDQKHLDAAIKASNFILEHMRRGEGGIYHTWKDGKARINGFLDDYSFVCEAFIELYQVCFDEKWLKEANALVEYVITHFQDDETSLFYYSGDDESKLITRKKDYYDNVVPSSNSSLAGVFYKLGILLDDSGYLDRSKKMVEPLLGQIERYPSAFTNWSSLLLYFGNRFFTVAISGKELIKTAKELSSHFLPNKLITGTDSVSTLPHLNNRYIEGKTMIYVCTGTECRKPTEDVGEAVGMMKTTGGGPSLRSG